MDSDLMLLEIPIVVNAKGIGGVVFERVVDEEVDTF